MMKSHAKQGKLLMVAVVGVVCALALCVLLGGCTGNSSSSSSSAATSSSVQAQAKDAAKAPDASKQAIASPKATAAGNTAQATARTEEERKATSDSLNDVKPSGNVVYLTFDDGPSTNTHRILEILDTYGIKATWFVKGQSGSLEYVKDIWNAGNQVAIHTDSHDYAAVYASEGAYWDDVEACGAKVKDYLGFEPTLVRFPGGSHNSYNKSVSDAIIADYPRRGFHYFDWNVSSGDGGDHTAAEIVGYVTESAAERHSCCVLMHDSAAKDTTVEALPEIIEWFIDHGFTFDVLLSDSFGYHF